MGAGGSKQQRYNRDLGERPSPPGKPILIPGTPRTDPDVISIRWDPPQYCGGSKITGYLVEHRRTGSPHWVRATPLLVRGNTLTLSGLEPGMRYQFRVTAENLAGKSEPGLLSEAFAVSYQRHVSLAPSFVKQLSDTTAIENEKVEFSVLVEGTPMPKISWYKDGMEVFSTRRQRILVEGEKSSFIIHQAALQDEGEIKCTATNIAGHVVTKASLTLEAGAGLRLPRQYEEGLLFELGEAVRLRVGVTGKPEPFVSWYHDGTEIQTGGRVELIRKDKYACLKIAEASRRDRGEYRVTATNKLGSDSASILVTITDRPLSPGKAQVVMTLGRCVTLAWTPPNDDGGCKIGNYIVEYYRIGWNMWLKAATCRQLTTTLGDLIEGSEYKFRVKAENPYGVSDPSSESDVVFIPDPKRGLLEAPPKGEGKDVLMIDSAEWQEATRKHKELEAAKTSADQEWNELPSQVSLANQVLRKVKMAPKRVWSEDSQGSPPTTPERQLHPVPPKRKLRDKRKAQAILEEGPSMVYDQDENETPKGALSPTRQESSNLRRYPSPDNVHSSSEMMIVIVPDEKEQIKEEAEEEAEEKEEDNEDYDKENSSFTLPPLSFSAPELGSCEPYELDTVRVSISSSELLHERTLARINKDIAEEEAEEVLKTKYGIERKRSFERRNKRDPHALPSTSFKDKNIDNDIYDVPEGIEGNRNKKIEAIDEQEEELEEEIRHRGMRRSSKDRFMQSDSSFEEFSTRIEDYEYVDDSEYDDDYDYEEGDDEYEGSDLDLKYDFEKSNLRRYLREEVPEEETFHRNMTMLSLPTPPLKPSSKESSPIPLITLNEQILDTSPPMKRKDSVETYLEELRKSAEREMKKSPEKIIRKSPERQIRKSPEQDFTICQNRFIRRSPEKEEIAIPQTSFKDVPSPPSPTSILPKPILKVNRDDFNDKKNDKKTRNIMNRMSLKKPNTEGKLSSISGSESVNSEKRNKKKVRIEEPFDNEYFEDDENLVITGEVAKNRRRMNKQKRDSNDPANVVISHYSDIVKEYGKTSQKPKPQLYLNYEELKAAAERSNPVNLDLNLPQNTAPTSLPLSSSQTSLGPSGETGKQQEESVQSEEQSKTASTVDVTAPTKFQSVTEFILDMVLFCIAVYLYFFKDPRLVVPVLILMIYRKIHDTVSYTISNKIKPKITKVRNFFKKPEKEE